MRMLVISDIHSNFEALKALDRIVQYDEVIFLGEETKVKLILVLESA